MLEVLTTLRTAELTTHTMAAAVKSVVPLEKFPVDTDLSDEFLKKADSGPRGNKETPENRAEKIQGMLRLINGEFNFIKFVLMLNFLKRDLQCFTFDEHPECELIKRTD